MTHIEQKLLSSDGLLTRATQSIPYKVRARHAVVVSSSGSHVHIHVGTSSEIVGTVDVSNTQLVDGEWTGSKWTIVDTDTWVSTTLCAGLDGEKAIAGNLAKTPQDASIEHLRNLLNKRLFLRPLATFEICAVVKDVLHRQFKGVHSFRAVKTAAKNGKESAS